MERITVKCPRCFEPVRLTLEVSPVLTFTHAPNLGFMTATAAVSGVTHYCVDVDKPVMVVDPEGGLIPATMDVARRCAERYPDWIYFFYTDEEVS